MSVWDEKKFCRCELDSKNGACGVETCGGDHGGRNVRCDRARVMVVLEHEQ